MENLAIIIDHLAFFTAIGNLLWQLGIFYTVLVHFSPFWYVVSRKIWQPCIVAFFLIKTLHSLVPESLINF
jgi:hypothetical protein